MEMVFFQFQNASGVGLSGGRLFFLELLMLTAAYLLLNTCSTGQQGFRNDDFIGLRLSIIIATVFIDKLLQMVFLSSFMV